MVFFEAHIDRELRPLGEGTLSARRFRRVIRHARSCHRCASLYERAIRALRQLENRDPFVPAQVELDTITTLNADRALPRASPRPGWALGGLVFAAALATLVVLVRPVALDGQFTPRGGAVVSASLRVFCGGSGAPLAELKGDASCRVGQSLAFAVGTDAATPAVVLLLSGVTAARSEAFVVTAQPGAEAPVAFTAQLDRPGALEVVATFAPDEARAEAAARGERVPGAVVVRKPVTVVP